MRQAWILGGLLLGCGARTGEAFPLGTNRSTGDGTAGAVDTNDGRGETTNGTLPGTNDGRRQPPDGLIRRPVTAGRPDPEPVGAAGSTSGGSLDPALMPVDDPAAFDTCSTPLDLASAAPVESSGTLAIVPSTSQGTCYENGADLFFRWTAPRTGAYVFSTAGSEFDSVVTLYSADCGSQLACNDDAPESTDLHAEVRADVMEGQSVVFVLSSYYDTSGGAYRVSVARTGEGEPPPR